MARITLTVTDDERDALVKMARVEGLDPRKLAAMLVREALMQGGYLPDKPIASTFDKHNQRVRDAKISELEVRINRLEELCNSAKEALDDG